MPLVPAAPPAHVQIFSGFDYVAADPARRRVYAAHTRSHTLLIVNADTGAVLGQVEVGPMHGVAVDPENGHVYTGDGESQTVSEVDPVTMTVVRTANVDGKVDAIAYDSALHRVYADEDDGTRVFVVDTKTMKQVAAIQIPGHKPEYLFVDPQTHDLYQNIANISEVAVINADQMKVTRTIPTPAIKNNHPLQYDPAYHIFMVGGKNGVLEAYTREGKLLGSASIQPAVDQCNYDSSTHLLACAGSGKVVVVKLSPQGTLTVVSSLDVNPDVGTVAFDNKTGHLWIVWSEDKGDFVQELELKP
jgi:DNA-binding beta-propeller fold protein YncE